MGLLRAHEQHIMTMFLVDVSPSMGTMRTLKHPPVPGGEERNIETTSLEWALQFVKYKIKEVVRANVYGRASIDVYSQIFCGRKTEHYGGHPVWVGR